MARVFAAKRITIVAGPNGAGKTTFAQQYLPKDAGFVNADLIAAELAPFAPETAAFQAGRIMLTEIARLAHKGQTFAFETTLSGRGYARLIPKWQNAGYRVSLIFLQLPSPEMAIARVQGRVRKGGHAIPDAVIHRRFAAGQRNLDGIYKPLVDDWILYDNAGSQPVFLDGGENDE